MNYFYILATVCLSCFSSVVSAEWFSRTESIMGTEVSATVWHSDKHQADLLLNTVMVEFTRLDNALSPYKTDSELFRINQMAAVAPVKITREFEVLINKSLFYSQLSNGAFDITFSSLGRFYNYREKQSPDTQKIKSLVEAINYQLITLNEDLHTIFFKHPDLHIDLGGIAKGYAVDRAIALLREKGVEHAVVSAGGDSRVLGDRRGRPWVIGIKNPRANDKVATLIPLVDTAISTSGDYERYFIDQASGQRVHHILNPRTGRSASEVTSVSVIGPDGFDTDPLSTTVFVMGVEKGLQLLNSLQGFDGIIIDRKGKVHYSNGLMPPESN